MSATTSIVMGLKPGSDPHGLVAMVESFVEGDVRILLASFVKIGVESDEALEELEAIRTHVERLAEELSAGGVPTAPHVGVSISPGTELLRLAEREHADLIVIGLGGRSRVGKALLGSDAQTVLLGASTPVLCKRLEQDSA